MSKLSSEIAHLSERIDDPDDPNAKRLDVWGFADSRFVINDAGDVTFTGNRYPISGQVLPSLLPWAREMIRADLAPGDIHASQYPTPAPIRIRNEAFETELAKIVGAVHVTTEDRIRVRHGHGHTQEDMWAVHFGRFDRVPDVVVRPATTHEVEQIVDAARRYQACLIPFGGGTNVSDALRCRTDEMRCIASVDVSRMNRVIDVDRENRVATIQAGATGLEINEALHQQGFTLGHEPDSFELSTLGGWIATHASGMKKNRYGNIEDLLLGLEVVTPSGRIFREQAPPRESIGGDPARWLLGSEGRFGIITQAQVKIFPVPEQRKFGSVLFRSFEDGFEFLRAARADGRLPASIRLLDNLQFQFGQALKPERKGFARWKSRLERAFVTRVRGFEADRMVACTLLFEGNRENVAMEEKAMYKLARRFGGMRAGAANGERGYALTFSIAYIRDFMMSHYILAESFETAVPWTQAQAVCENVKQRLYGEHEKRGLPGSPFVSCRITQLYDTGVCIYFYYAFLYKDIDQASELYADLERAAREEILRAGGSLSHHHGVGKLRQRFLPAVLSEPALAWRHEMKRAVDPDNVFGCANS